MTDRLSPARAITDTPTFSTSYVFAQHADKHKHRFTCLWLFIDTLIVHRHRLNISFSMKPNASNGSEGEISGLD